MSYPFEVTLGIWTCHLHLVFCLNELIGKIQPKWKLDSLSLNVSRLLPYPLE